MSIHHQLVNKKEMFIKGVLIVKVIDIVHFVNALRKYLAVIGGKQVHPVIYLLT